VILLTAVAVVVLISGLTGERSGESDQPSTPTQQEVVPPEPQSRIQEEGPLADGERVSLQEALSRSPYDLPVPPTNDRTETRSGIWIDPTDQIAFVWASDLRFYSAPTKRSSDEVEAQWRAKVKEQSSEGWEMGTVRGASALTLNGSGELSPSSITWQENGLVLQFVSPVHDLELIRSFADEIVFENSA
jgi:hypothetical protein